VICEIGRRSPLGKFDLAGSDLIDRFTGAKSIGATSASAQAVDFEFAPGPERDEVAGVLISDQQAGKIVLGQVECAPVDSDQVDVEARKNGLQRSHGCDGIQMRQRLENPILRAFPTDARQDLAEHVRERPGCRRRPGLIVLGLAELCDQPSLLLEHGFPGDLGRGGRAPKTVG
jgi:hypothetical protein